VLCLGFDVVAVRGGGRIFGREEREGEVDVCAEGGEDGALVDWLRGSDPGRGFFVAREEVCGCGYWRDEILNVG
jgi:hypothetical protein